MKRAACLLSALVRVWSPRPHPICSADLSELPLPGLSDRLWVPAGLEAGAVRPGLRHVQAEVCRCLPRRPDVQPAAVHARLHIRPNAGEMQVTYRVDAAADEETARLVACLGSPTLRVEPISYRTDMVTEDGPVDEVLVYPVRLDLQSGVGQR